MAHEITLTVNGRPYTATAEPRRTLADFLRDDLDLTGTHLGCEHGVCGACTVLLNGSAVRSCLVLAVQADGAEVATVEGLAGDDGLNRLQQAFHEAHALQCGFCTPGLLMTGTELLSGERPPTSDEIREAVSGHICRCTGYVSVMAAIEAAASPDAE
jgi:aerobic-type carbon monoxide dehydrogenase small subunit (CoxS/CutS family)